MKDYDILLVGAGLFSSVIAERAAQKGKKCLVLERRSHIGGNIYTEKRADIQIHKYGAHIFHTDRKDIWDYICTFSDFNNYVNCPIANFKGVIYNLPFNMNTFNKIWPDVITPEQAKKRIDEQASVMKGIIPVNLEEQAISLIGQDIYECLIKGYTEKQWGRPCSELSPEIINRLPVRFTYDNNYFNDRYQGIPIGGYTRIISKMLSKADVHLNVDFLDDKNSFLKMADKIVYTGLIDEYFSYKLGALEYRSLRFETEELSMENYQGNAVVNYTERDIPFTRIIEHKHFDSIDSKKTVISREYPLEWGEGYEPFYPMNNSINNVLYEEYNSHAKIEHIENNVYFGGRLGMYKYFDMDDTIIEAQKMAEVLLSF